MSNETMITLSRGGDEERTLPISEVYIPELYHIARDVRLNSKLINANVCSEVILLVWHIANDLKRHIVES